ncbi:MAG: hypothetical protein NT123_02790 [Proteobacteria bacterium]|nr:hypothetical protein [Pseudomonadota bacterium]
MKFGIVIAFQAVAVSGAQARIFELNPFLIHVHFEQLAVVAGSDRFFTPVPPRA